MAVSTDDVRRQLGLGEDSRWEFKQIEFRGDRPVSPRRDDLADELAAFANARGGVLVCGVTDDGDVQGMSRAQMNALDRILSDACADSIKPPIDVEITRHDLGDGKPLLVVEVAPGEAQHDSPGGSYRRVGSSKRQMTPDQRLRLAQQRGQSRFLWFDRQPVPETGFETLSERLWKPLVSVAGTADPRRALRNLRLLTQDDGDALRATVAGILLCTETPERWFPNAAIMATRYRGADRASGQLDAQQIVGPVHQQIADAVRFAVRNMRVAARKTPGRVDMPQYSSEALFEALVNAVAHRGLLHVRPPYQVVDVRGPTGDRFARRAAQRHDHRQHGSQPGDPERGHRLRFRTPVGRRHSGIGESSVPDGTTRRRRHDHRQENAGDSRKSAYIRGDRRIERAAHHSRRGSGAHRGASRHHRAVGGPAADRRRDSGAVPERDLEAWRHGCGPARAAIELHSTHLPMTVYAAAPGHAAHVEREWTPSRGALALELPALPRGGAAIFSEAVGHLPGLRGRLNPILDALDRTYLYADNISINDGMQQPVHFVLGEDLRLTDAWGYELLVRVVDIAGRSALVEYRVAEP